MRFLSFIFLAFSLIYIITYLKFKNYIPILMYHRIGDENDRNCLSPEDFEAEIKYLKDHNYKTITPDEFLTHYEKRGDLPKKSIMLTFDDAYKDTFQVALPILKKYNMKAVVFPITNFLDKENNWEKMGKEKTSTMSVEDLKIWQKDGNAIGSHTKSHYFLTQIKEDTLEEELRDSKDFIEEHFKDCISICYPYGDVDKKVSKKAKDMGYQMGFAIFENAPLWNIDIMRLPRVPISKNTTLQSFKKKISPYHIVYLYMRQVERKVKKIRNAIRNKF